jgi:hypothetical protein
MAIVGAAVGLVARGPRAVAGLWAGQLLSFAVLWVVQFGTDINTVINTEQVATAAQFAPLIILVWLAFLGIAALSFSIASAVRVRMGR